MGGLYNWTDLQQSQLLSLLVWMDTGHFKWAFLNSHNLHAIPRAWPSIYLHTHTPTPRVG